MKSLDARTLGGMVFVAIVAALAAWFVLRPDRPVVARAPTPENASNPENSAPAEPPSDPGSDIRGLEIMGAGDDVEVEIPPVAGVEMPEGVVHTETCRLIAGWAQGRVPHYTILDNIRDRSMRFTEDDRACLAAARDVPPIVVRFADRYKKSDADLR